MQNEMLAHAADLCKEAAKRLRENYSPQKEASEVVDSMIAKGLIPQAEEIRYANLLAADPEKLAALKTSVAALPARAGYVSEISGDKIASDGGLDAFDNFVLN